MNTWKRNSHLSPAVELLVRRWDLPEDKASLAEQLLLQQEEGHTALPLADALPVDDKTWGKACRLLKVGEKAETVSPLVCHEGRDGNRHLQTWRFHKAEESIAKEILTRSRAPEIPIPASIVRHLVNPKQALGLNPLQEAAVRCALSHSLTLITGGPGTGKTYTLARLLSLLIASTPEHPPVIRLSAPTGKAADRMREAIEAAVTKLEGELASQSSLQLKAAAKEACTLHRLLRFNPRTGLCAYDEECPLPAEIVIVDECSMVDTLLWQALLKAIPSSARIILLGDPNQLESVSAGDVLGALVRAARGNSPLAAHWVELSDSQRFKNRPGIGRLANAIIANDANTAVSLLHSNPATHDEMIPATGLSWIPGSSGRLRWQQLPASVRMAISRIAFTETPEEALRCINLVRILTGHRDHDFGASGINRLIQAQLAQERPGASAPNEPIIIDENDPDTQLMNGSVGIIMQYQGGRRAYFPPAPGESSLRAFGITQLPAWRSAWAMTIHRSQGSEFEEVVVVLPHHDSNLATRELLYTAITRAKSCVHIIGEESTLAKALKNAGNRITLLEDKLGKPTP